ncbi:glycosyltransferase [Dactylosporangium sp. NPDC006015]|uniref:glycosyltransferase n=1 Tax=Dactylosporangium sp. NPDC006015 TaxID=3154576 RepID=UPI0033BE201B
MRVLFFGTYDTAMHPRVGVLAEGLRGHGADVVECNAPLGVGTAARVAAVAQPWRLPGLVLTVARRWVSLARAARRVGAVDAVVVGYLGLLDVHLARLLFRRVPIVLDHMTGAGDTAADRRLGGRLRRRLLAAVDRAALRRADLIVVDTDEHRDALPARHHARSVAVAVGAPSAWFTAGREQATDAGARQAPAAPALRVVFFGLYTPLQGATVIGEAARLLAGEGVTFTMVGQGQDEAATRHAAEGADVAWLPWVPAGDLPALVAGHDVCLGIFGTSDKAMRVVPNKVFQGAAAGCAVVTSDSPPQRRALGDAALLVPAGDPHALATTLRRLATDRSETARLRQAARRLAEARFTPEHVVTPLWERLGDSGAGEPAGAGRLASRGRR